MKGYNRKNPEGYPSMDYEKRKRHSYRKNQYEGTSSADMQKYKSLRLQIKRKHKILYCNSKRKNY